MKVFGKFDLFYFLSFFLCKVGYIERFFLFREMLIMFGDIEFNFGLKEIENIRKFLFEIL